MHDADVHVNALCPNCDKEALQAKSQDISCDHCECSWSWEEILKERQILFAGLERLKNDASRLIRTIEKG